MAEKTAPGECKYGSQLHSVSVFTNMFEHIVIWKWNHIKWISIWINAFKNVGHLGQIWTLIDIFLGPKYYCNLGDSQGPRSALLLWCTSTNFVWDFWQLVPTNDDSVVCEMSPWSFLFPRCVTAHNSWSNCGK